MEDLIQCSAAQDNFQRWLAWGKGPMEVYKGEKAAAMLVSVGKNPNVDYLYQTAMEKDNSISWSNSLSFCGVYDRKNQALYLTESTRRVLMDGRAPLVTESVPSMRRELCDRINQRVENVIANDRNNLPVRKITGDMALRSLQYYQEYGAKEDAVRQFFDGEAPDGQFHSGYTLNDLSETAFLAYIQDPEGFIQTETEMYIKTNQEKFLQQFLENDALMAEYQALTRDTGSPIHQMKAITDAVKASGAKTVTVTVQKGGQELTFKTEASSLTGYRNRYSTYDIQASDRREFEKLFGRYTDYNAEDITRITYGRNTIYEAAPAQTEEMAAGMGGMTFG